MSSFQSYVLKDELSITKGKGGLPFIKVENDYAKALISIYGAQVLSYQAKSQDDDLFFVSENAYFEQGKAIKGGVPICWPWFGRDAENPDRQMHGFARNILWKIESTSSNIDSTQIILSLSDSEESLKLWPHEFKLTLTIKVGQTLNLSLKTENSGYEPFKITQALHSYFSMSHISEVEIIGLDGIEYIDTVNGANALVLQQGNISVNQEVDRIYMRTPASTSIIDKGSNRKISLNSMGSNTTVVWNPWVDISKNSGDLTDDAYQQFVCVETANAAEDVIEIQPNENYTIGVGYSIA